MYELLISILLFVILFYIGVSGIEWFVHKYIMHGKSISLLSESHMFHHKNVNLDQSLNTDKLVSSIIVNFGNITTYLLIIPVIMLGYILWFLLGLDKFFPLIILFIVTITYSIVNIVFWNSIHPAFHGAYIKMNMKYDDEEYIWGPPNFRIDINNPIYKIYYKHHTLHHLNKGKSKGNYNIIQLGFDYFMGTKTHRVDNRLHFLDPENKPKTPQEEWLYDHQVFDIKIGDNNEIFYKEINDINSDSNNEWKSLPNIF